MKPLEAGDVFIIPTGDGRAGVGQVIATYGESSQYFAIFDCVFPLAEATERSLTAVSSPVLFIALSTDAMIFGGEWTVVGRSAINPEIPLPAYKTSLGGPKNIVVIDYSGLRMRPATPEESARLPYRTNVSPIGLEKALRASLGLEPWHETFDKLRVENVVPSSAMFEGKASRRNAFILRLRRAFRWN